MNYALTGSVLCDSSFYDLDTRLEYAYLHQFPSEIIYSQLPTIEPKYDYVDNQKKLEQRFQDLVRQWDNETKYSSSITEIISHSAYHNIIAMGPQVLPLLFKELEQRPHFLFEAIRAILERDGKILDPVSKSARGDLRKMTNAWLEWARENNYLD